MLDKSMTLNQVINCTPTLEELSVLPLEVNSLIKVVIVAQSQKAAYDFIRYMFSDDNQVVLELFKDLSKTVFYDFDHTNYEVSKYIMAGELYATEEQETVTRFLEELLEDSPIKDIEVVFDLFDTEEKHYRIALYDDKAKTTLIPDHN